MLIIVIGAFYTGRSMGKSNASKEQGETQERTINALQATILALQADVQTLQRRADESAKENARLELTIDTICSALKIKGFVITIQGEMITIDDKNGTSTMARIHDKEAK